MLPKAKTTTTTLKDIKQNVQFVIGNVVLKQKLSFFITLPFEFVAVTTDNSSFVDGSLIQTVCYKMSKTVTILSFLSLGL